MMSPIRAEELAANPGEYAWRAVQEAAYVLDRSITVPLRHHGHRLGDVQISRWNSGLYKGHAYFHPLLGEDLWEVAAVLAGHCVAHQFSVEFRWNEHRFTIKPGAFYLDILNTYYSQPRGEYVIEPRSPPRDAAAHPPRERSVTLDKL
jgi:hypothetical protein